MIPKTAYTLSNLSYDHVFGIFKEGLRPFAFFCLRAEDLQPMILAYPEMMHNALDYIRQEYGSIETYLSQAVGLDGQTLGRLKDNLLD
jgi:hypothetical protein